MLLRTKVNPHQCTEYRITLECVLESVRWICSQARIVDSLRTGAYRLCFQAGQVEKVETKETKKEL